MHCWKCREPVNGAVCNSCTAIQPPPPSPDYFRILGLPRSYFLEGLAAAHRKVSRKVHPDRFARRPAVERRMSLQWTAAINTAKRVLEDPLSRARYIATGRIRPREDNSLTLDPEFLEEIFDLQMLAMESPEEARTKAAKEYEELNLKLESIFRTWEASGGSLAVVEENLAKMKYFHNLMT